MSFDKSHSGRRAATIFVLAVLALTGCGQASSSDTTEGGDGGGLRVRLTGVVTGTTLCPGGTRPCATLEGDLSFDGEPLPTSDPVHVTGILADGILAVEEIEPHRSTLDWLVDHCDNKKTEAEFLEFAATSPEESGIEEGGDLEDYDQLGLYQLTISESFATRWQSPRQVIHLGVVGDAQPHEAALAELGLDDYVCVVGGFARSDDELKQIQDEVGPFLKAWPEAQSWSAGRNAHLGSVQVDLPRADAALLAKAEERFGDGMELNASILVLNGTLTDYDEAIISPEPEPNGGNDTPTTDSVGLVASCGSVVFSSLPPELGDFDPVDAEIEAVLDEFANGPLSVESDDFVSAYQWSVAERTETKLVLFGQSDNGQFATASFANRDGVWAASGWGGCQMEIDAPGFGSARTILDPDREPDPKSTELAILIQERDCAGGEAPVDREVLPVVIESETTIEIVTLVEPVAGGADCPSNPWHPVTITLKRPLGDRLVLDGQSSPAEERTWPPSEADLNG